MAGSLHQRGVIKRIGARLVSGSERPGIEPLWGLDGKQRAAVDRTGFAVSNGVCDRYGRHHTDGPIANRSDHSLIDSCRRQGTSTVVHQDHTTVHRHGSKAVTNRFRTRLAARHHHQRSACRNNRLIECISWQHEDDTVAVGSSSGDRVIDNPNPAQIEELFARAEASARTGRDHDRPYRSILDTAHVT